MDSYDDDEDEQLLLALAASRETARQEQKQIELAIQASLRSTKPPKDQAGPSTLVIPKQAFSYKIYF